MEELATLVLLNENVEREIRWMLKRRAELQEGYGNQAVGDQKHHITEAALKLDRNAYLDKNNDDVCRVVPRPDCS